MALLVALLNESGCATWGAGDVRKLGSTGADPSRLLVITAVDALELRPVKVQELSLELMALGAPPALVARTHRAALDEVEHARLCFAMASAYAGHPLGPAPLREALVGDTADLRRLARESLLDGCIGEGMAAEMARLGAEHARDPEVVRVMKVQAADERSHAELSWATVEWCLGQGGEALRRELLAALGEARMPACHDLPEHGRVGRLMVEPHFAKLVAATRARLLAAPVVEPAARLPAASRG